MTHYKSDFTSSFNEFAFQTLENLRLAIQVKNEILVEEIEGGLCLKVLISEKLFQVESLSDSLEEALHNAATKILQMITYSRESEEAFSESEEEVVDATTDAVLH